MAQELVDIVSKSSKQSLIDAQKYAENLNKSLQDTIIYAKQANDNLSGSKGLEDFNKKAELARQAQERTAKAVAQTQLAEERLNTVRLKNEAIRAANEKKAIADDEKRIASIKKKTATIISSSKEEVKAAMAANNAEKDWIAISNKGNIERNKSAAAAMAISKQNKIVTETVVEQTKSVDVAEKSAKKYTSGFATGLKGVWSALKNVAYLLPGLGIAGLLGFIVDPIISAISNLEVFKKKALETIREISTASTEYAKSLKDVASLGTSLEEFKSGIISRDEVVKRYNETIGETIGKLTTVQQVEDFYNKNAAKFIQATFLRAKANAALTYATDKLVEAQQRALGGASFGDFAKAGLKSIMSGSFNPAQFMSNAIAAQQAASAKLLKEGEEGIKSFSKLQTEADLFARTNGINFRPKTNADLATARKSAAALVEIEIEAQRKIADIYRAQADNPDFSLEARLDAQERFDTAMIAIAELTGKKEIAAKKNTANEIKAINANVETDKSKVLTDSLKFQDKLYRDALKREVDAFKEGTRVLEEQLKQRISARIEESNIELENVENTRVEISNKVGEDYANGIIKREEYQRKLNQIDREAAKRALEIQIATNDAVIAIQQADLDNFGIGDQKSINDNMRKNTALKIRLSKLGTDAVIEDLERERKAREELNDAIKKLAFDAFDLGKQLIGQMFEARIEDNQKEIDALDQRTKTQIENVNESVLTEKEKSDKIAIIEANAANKRQQLEQRQRQIKIQQARADRAFQVGEAIASTALAVVKALPNLILAGIVGAIGAVQIASIIAAPLPKFAKGGKMKADGLAEYGHGMEIRIDPDGTASFTPSTPEVGFVKKDTQFISAPDTKRLLAKPQLNDVAGKSWDVERLLANDNKNAKELKKAILKREKQRSVSEFSRSETQMRAYYKRNGF